MSLEGGGKENVSAFFFEYFVGEKLLNGTVLHSCSNLFNGQGFQQIYFEGCVQVKGGYVNMFWELVGLFVLVFVVLLLCFVLFVWFGVFVCFFL